MPPVQANGLILSYTLMVSSGLVSISLEQGLNTTTVLSELAPFTLYRVVVSVTNTEGTTSSSAANITTGETGKPLPDVT